MPEWLAKLRTIWNGWTLARRAAFVAAVLVPFGGLAVAAFWQPEPDLGVLMTGLRPDDAAAIVQRLESSQVPHRVGPDGTTVLVPRERIAELRLQMASAGLPRGGGIGFEIFDQQRFGASELEQQVSLQRALEGELARTIEHLGPVESARVHLALPPRSVFVAEDRPPTAAIALALRPGRTLPPGDVRGIVHLVSSAVPGLDAEHVTVVGSRGEVLHRPRGEGDTEGGGDDERTRMENEQATRVRELLENVVGRGHVDVRVSFVLDRTRSERTEERYDPERTTVRSEETTEERSAELGAEDDTMGEGVPGADANLEGDTGDLSGTEGAAGPVVRRTSARNYEIDRVASRSVDNGGRVLRMSLAVVVDGKWTGTGSRRRFEPLPRAELDRLSQLARNAVGFDSARGDQATIECFPFRGDDVDAAAPAQASGPVPEAWRALLPYGAAGLVALVVAGVVGVMVVSRRRRRKIERREAAASLARDAALAGDEPADGEVLEDHRASLQRVAEIAARDPDTALLVIRSWMAEG